MTSSTITPFNPSPYLIAAAGRCADRAVLVQRDVDMMLEGLRLKEGLLQGLLEKIKLHRREDVAQLLTAHKQTWFQWDERLLRLKEWQVSAGPLARSSNGFLAWKENGIWFERAQAIARRLGERFAIKIERLEKQGIALEERIRQWSDRIVFKEMELHEFMEKRTSLVPELLVPAALKRSYLQFLFDEREEEGRFGRELQAMTKESNRGLERLSRGAAMAAKKAETNPAHFEASKNLTIAVWKPFEQRLSQSSQKVVDLGVIFEQGRQHLRSIYEIVQKMKMVEVPVSRRRPLLHRLFNLTED